MVKGEIMPRLHVTEFAYADMKNWLETLEPDSTEALDGAYFFGRFAGDDGRGMLGGFFAYNEMQQAYTEGWHAGVSLRRNREMMDEY